MMIRFALGILIATFCKPVIGAKEEPLYEIYPYPSYGQSDADSGSISLNFAKLSESVEKFIPRDAFDSSRLANLEVFGCSICRGILQSHSVVYTFHDLQVCGEASTTLSDFRRHHFAHLKCASQFKGNICPGCDIQGSFSNSHIAFGFGDPEIDVKISNVSRLNENDFSAYILGCLQFLSTSQSKGKLSVSHFINLLPAFNTVSQDPLWLSYKNLPLDWPFVTEHKKSFNFLLFLMLKRSCVLFIAVLKSLEKMPNWRLLIHHAIDSIENFAAFSDSSIFCKCKQSIVASFVVFYKLKCSTNQKTLSYVEKIIELFKDNNQLCEECAEELQLADWRKIQKLFLRSLVLTVADCVNLYALQSMEWSIFNEHEINTMIDILSTKTPKFKANLMFLIEKGCFKNFLQSPKVNGAGICEFVCDWKDVVKLWNNGANPHFDNETLLNEFSFRREHLEHFKMFYAQNNNRITDLTRHLGVALTRNNVMLATHLLSMANFSLLEEFLENFVLQLMFAGSYIVFENILQRCHEESPILSRCLSDFWALEQATRGMKKVLYSRLKTLGHFQQVSKYLEYLKVYDENSSGSIENNQKYYSEYALVRKYFKNVPKTHHLKGAHFAEMIVC